MSRQRKRRLSLERRVLQLEAIIKDMQTTLGLRRLEESCGEDTLKQYQAWWNAQQQAQVQAQNIWPGQIISQTSTTSGTIGSLLGTALPNIAQVSGITKTTT